MTDLAEKPLKNNPSNILLLQYYQNRSTLHFTLEHFDIKGFYNSIQFPLWSSFFLLFSKLLWIEQVVTYWLFWPSRPWKLVREQPLFKLAHSEVMHSRTNYQFLGHEKINVTLIGIRTRNLSISNERSRVRTLPREILF